jgi:hypothetical protein
VDNLGVLAPATKQVVAVGEAIDLPRTLHDACALAASTPYGPTAVEIPSDMMSGFHDAVPAGKQVKASGGVSGLRSTPPSAKAVLAAAPPAAVSDAQRAAGPFKPALDKWLRKGQIVVSDPGISSYLAAQLGAQRLLLPPRSTRRGPWGRRRPLW